MKTKKSTGQSSDDTEITTKVEAKLMVYRIDSGLRIDVETYRRTLQLSRLANSTAEINQDEALTRQTEGVRSVMDDIHLKKWINSQT